MNILIAFWCLTTLIAFFSVLSAEYAPLQHRLLPWTGGLLLGIGLFWILPEMAEDRGWWPAFAGVSGILILLGLIDRYLYPICPFCAASVHAHHHAHGAAGSCRHAIKLGWPLLILGCIHMFFDGWTIALSHVPSVSSLGTALSWGAIVHNIPESVAIGVVAARLTLSQKRALLAVALLQTLMAAGGVLALAAGSAGSRLPELSAMPACAFLLLFGFLALEEEWRINGGTLAVRAAAPGLVGCGIAAMMTMFLTR
jgi:zinc transporter ZupT